jgi:hypothetical protein
MPVNLLEKQVLTIKSAELDLPVRLHSIVRMEPFVSEEYALNPMPANMTLNVKLTMPAVMSIKKLVINV